MVPSNRKRKDALLWRKHYLFRETYLPVYVFEPPFYNRKIISTEGPDIFRALSVGYLVYIVGEQESNG